MLFMPYEWTTPPHESPQRMHLWPHQSLPEGGFVAFIAVTFAMIMLPTLALLGTSLLWGLLPFVLAAVAGIYLALRRNHRAREIEEWLTLERDTAHLIHTTARGEVKEWHCNRYWAKVTKYDSEGPVPHYVTLRGDGNEVEIGAFLSEDERISLYDDLYRNLRQ